MILNKKKLEFKKAHFSQIFQESNPVQSPDQSTYIAL